CLHVVWRGALLLLFCGRPTWGVLFTLLGADDVQLHRLVGGLHAFGFFLSGLGLGTIWLWFVKGRSRYRYVPAVLALFVILVPALTERRFYLEQNAEWSQTNLSAFTTEENHLTAAVSALRADEGRTYSGLAATWGNHFRVGSVPFHAI